MPKQFWRWLEARLTYLRHHPLSPLVRLHNYARVNGLDEKPDFHRARGVLAGKVPNEPAHITIRRIRNSTFDFWDNDEDAVYDEP